VWGILWGDSAPRGGLRRTEADWAATLRQTERGSGGLSRTLWESAGSPFKTAALNHSATTPERGKLFPHSVLRKLPAALSYWSARSCEEDLGNTAGNLSLA
jgi:hypothetical protein